MRERFQGMTPADKEQFIARMKSRGQDTSAFDGSSAVGPGQATARVGDAGKGAAGKTAPSGASAMRQKYGAPASAQTIDALFAPLPTVETRGRAWLFMGHELKPVNLRLGISDGTNTELLSGELQPNQEVVTGVTGLGTTRTQSGQTGSGNPLMPGGRGPGGGFGGQGGRGR
jgi:hypothetical protein